MFEQYAKKWNSLKRMLWQKYHMASEKAIGGFNFEVTLGEYDFKLTEGNQGMIFTQAYRAESRQMYVNGKPRSWFSGKVSFTIFLEEQEI